MIAILVAASLLLYLDERNVLEHTYSAGDGKAANRVDLSVTVQKVDVANSQLLLRILPDPTGDLLSRDGTLSKSLIIDSGSDATSELVFPAGQSIAAKTIQASLTGGAITDYPFDHYSVALAFAALAGGRQVPIHVMLKEIDPFFVTKVTDAAPLQTGLVLDVVRISRSRGTLILAWFIIIAMWALALSVLGAAHILIRRRQGIVWPSLGWMAATLFALIGMRNAAPGSPPIGSLIDYASFFWAEAIVAGSLVVVAATGIRTEYAALAREREEQRSAS